jgi:hypothetical protein
MNTLETMQCYDDARERSDSQVLAQNRRFELVEKRLEPLDLTAEEQIEFLSEYCAGFQHIERTEHMPETFIVWSDWFETTRARTLSEAICLAAAKWKEVNDA